MENAPFTSDELNYLVYRYLLENGFQHTAFSFSAESKITNSLIEETMVPRGALVSIVQKGLHFTEAEFFSALAANSNEKLDALKYERVLGSIGLLDAVLPDAERAKKLEQKIVEELGEEACSQFPLNIKISEQPRPSSAISAPSTHSSVDMDTNNVDEEDDGFEKVNANAEFAGTNKSPQTAGIATTSIGGHCGKRAAAAAMAQIDTTNLAQTFHKMSVQYPNGKLLPPNTPNPEIEIDRNMIRILQGHQADVFNVSWNPCKDIFSTGSGDSTARMWFTGPEIKSVVLKHESLNQQSNEDKDKDVTSLHWNVTGDYLATGCYDGIARIWNAQGEQVTFINAHSGPIFALKWNGEGKKVVSAGVDASTVVWDPYNNNNVKQFKFHQQSALDVDWISNDTFVSCSVDKTIRVCHIDSNEPLKTLRGHTHEVNTVKFDKFSGLLASCSDDKTLKVWDLKFDSPVYDVHAHDKEIYTIRWSPKGSVIASASFDHSIKLWDLSKKQSSMQLMKHTESVYTVAFHPEGNLLASGSFDKSINIWDIRIGNVVQYYTGNELGGGFFEVDWNRNGDQLAAAAARGVLLLFDLRYLRAQLNR